MIQDNKARYRELAKRHDLPLFFQPFWMDMVSPAWNVAMVEQDNELLGVWVYTIEKKLGLTIVRNPFFTPYLGPFFFLTENQSIRKRFKKEEEIIAELIRQIPSWGFMDVMCLPRFNNFLPFHHLGFKHTQRITYRISLDLDETTLWEKIDSKQRYRIRQAEKDLKIVGGIPFIDLFFEFHKETFLSKGSDYNYPEKSFKELIIKTIKNGNSYFNAVVNGDEELVGIVFCPFDKKNMYLLLSATNRNHRHHGAIAYLIWDAMLFAKRKGLKIFDFEGSMNKGIELFFRSFGGERQTYLHLRSYKSLLWKWREALRGK